jgi:hypothetical protein
VLTALSHLAVGLSSSRVLDEDCVALLAARAKAGGRQPLEQAAFEASAGGVELSMRALRHWHARLETVRAPTFPATYQPDETPFSRGELCSVALALAVDTLPARHQCSTSTVVLAAHGIVFARLTGDPSHPALLMAPNRSAGQLRHAVGCLAQPVSATVDRTDLLVADVVRTTRWAALVAYRNGQYDPAQLGELEREVAAHRAVELNPGCYSNDTRASRPRATSPPAAETIRAMCAATTFQWRDRQPAESAQCFLEIFDKDDAMVLSLLVDTAVVPPERARTLLHDIESLLVSEAVRSGSGF